MKIKTVGAIASVIVRSGEKSKEKYLNFRQRMVNNILDAAIVDNTIGYPRLRLYAIDISVKMIKELEKEIGMIVKSDMFRTMVLPHVDEPSFEWDTSNCSVDMKSEVKCDVESDDAPKEYKISQETIDRQTAQKKFYEELDKTREARVQSLIYDSNDFDDATVSLETLQRNIKNKDDIEMYINIKTYGIDMDIVKEETTNRMHIYKDDCNDYHIVANNHASWTNTNTTAISKLNRSGSLIVPSVRNCDYRNEEDLAYLLTSINNTIPQHMLEQYNINRMETVLDLYGTTIHTLKHEELSIYYNNMAKGIYKYFYLKPTTIVCLSDRKAYAEYISSIPYTKYEDIDKLMNEVE